MGSVTCAGAVALAAVSLAHGELCWGYLHVFVLLLGKLRHGAGSSARRGVRELIAAASAFVNGCV